MPSSQVGRARRELERVEDERDRARKDGKGCLARLAAAACFHEAEIVYSSVWGTCARRLETARLALEAEVKGLKRDTGQQLRELQAKREATLRALQDAHEAARQRTAQHQVGQHPNAARADHKVYQFESRMPVRAGGGPGPVHEERRSRLACCDCRTAPRRPARGRSPPSSMPKLCIACACEGHIAYHVSCVEHRDTVVQDNHKVLEALNAAQDAHQRLLTEHMQVGCYKVLRVRGGLLPVQCKGDYELLASSTHAPA